jgi:hypothetical protein
MMMSRIGSIDERHIRRFMMLFMMMDDVVMFWGNEKPPAREIATHPPHHANLTNLPPSSFFWRERKYFACYRRTDRATARSPKTATPTTAPDTGDKHK